MSPKVLIADDSNVFRDLEAKILEMRGYTVVHAPNGAEALKHAIADKPDIILLDIQMPVMDGVQVLTALKHNPSTKGIPVIMISTIGREKDRDLLLRGGADAFLSKPINSRDLLRHIRQLIRRSTAPQQP